MLARSLGTKTLSKEDPGSTRTLHIYDISYPVRLKCSELLKISALTAAHYSPFKNLCSLLTHSTRSLLVTLDQAFYC